MFGSRCMVACGSRCVVVGGRCLVEGGSRCVVVGVVGVW